ncbi:MAG: translation initiation factor 2 [Desulfovibrio sp.]|nr:translation initiation factor 2 [Desulfovibrio sp.]
MKTQCLLCVFSVVLACCATAVPAGGAASVSKSMALYARDMEFYYQNKRPEVLPGILRVFDAQGVLADGEKRLATAAFLAEALRHDASARGRVLPPAASLSRNARRTLAWTAHLAGFPDEAALLGQLLDKDDAVLLRQIQESPVSLARWNISESSVLQMYWAAFFAAGKDVWLDAIINAALRYSRLNAAGLQNNPDYAAGAAAAASLYETAPRHAAVHARLESFLKDRTNSAEIDTLLLILRKK